VIDQKGGLWTVQTEDLSSPWLRDARSISQN